MNTCEAWLAVSAYQQWHPCMFLCKPVKRKLSLELSFEARMKKNSKNVTTNNKTPTLPYAPSPKSSPNTNSSGSISRYVKWALPFLPISILSTVSATTYVRLRLSINLSKVGDVICVSCGGEEESARARRGRVTCWQWWRWWWQRVHTVHIGWEYRDPAELWRGQWWELCP